MATPGSTGYYSLLFTPPAQRVDLLAIRAWQLELANVLLQCSDASVAQRKLAWWGEELSRAASGHPRHPVTRALDDVLALPGARGSLARMLTATAERIQPRRAVTFDDLERHCSVTAGEAGALGARVGGAARDPDVGAATELSVAIELASVVHTVPREPLGRERLLPLEELAGSGVQLVDFTRRDTSPELRAWLGAHGERIGRRLDAAMAAIPTRLSHAQQHALIEAAIVRAQLRALARVEYRVLERSAGVTPLRKLWIAWRVHRRARARGHRSRAGTGA